MGIELRQVVSGSIHRSRLPSGIHDISRHDSLPLHSCQRKRGSWNQVHRSVSMEGPKLRIVETI